MKPAFVLWHWPTTKNLSTLCLSVMTKILAWLHSATAWFMLISGLIIFMESLTILNFGSNGEPPNKSYHARKYNNDHQKPFTSYSAKANSCLAKAQSHSTRTELKLMDEVHRCTIYENILLGMLLLHYCDQDSRY